MWDEKVQKVKNFFIDTNELNERESEIFIYLWYYGSGTIPKMADYTGYPPSTIPRILRKLIKAGYVEHSPNSERKKSSPQHYRAIDPSGIIRAKFSAFKDVMNSIENIQQDLEYVREKNNENDDGTIYINENHKSSMKEIIQKLKNSKKSIMIYGTDCSMLGEISEILVERAKNKIDVKIIGTFHGEKGELALSLAKKHGINVKIAKYSMLPFCIIDEKELLVAIEHMAGKYWCIMIKNMYAVRRFSSLFKEMGGKA